MNKYSTYLKVLENKRIFEHAFNKEKTNEIERLKNAGDNKGLLNIFNNDINSIKTQLSDINFNDISIKKTHDYYIL